MKPFYCTKFVIAPMKGFRLVRDMPECKTELSKKKKKKKNSRDIPACRGLFKCNFISQEKGKKNQKKPKNLRKTCHCHMIT